MDDISSRKPISCFLLPLKNAVLLTAKDHNKNLIPNKVNTPVPYPFKKVGILAYGTQKEVEDILPKTFYRFKSEDTIFGLVAVRVKTLRQYSRMIHY